MAKGIDISIAADTRSAMSAINRGLLEPLEDVSEQLEQLGDDSKDAGRDLERGMRDAQRRTDDAADEIRKLRDELNKAGRAGKSTGDDVDDGMGRIKRAGAEASDELRQNLGETFSSFRGDLEDLPQIAQDVFGGLAGSIGGLPAAFGLAAGAAGIGLLVAGFQQLQEQEEARKERVHEWAQAYIDSSNLIIGAAHTVAEVQEIATDPERYAEAKENAKNWGVDVSTAMRAMAGDATALTIAQENLAAKGDEVAAATERAGGNIKGLDYDMRTARGEYNLGTKALEELRGEMSEGASIAQQVSSSLLGIVSSSSDAAVEVDELGNRLVTLPDETQVLIDAETGQATQDVSRFKGDTDGMIESLNGRDVVLSVKSEVAAAQREVDGFIVRNNGRTIQFKSRVISAEGDWQ